MLTDETLEQLASAGEARWEEFRLDRSGAYAHLIQADLRGVADELRSLRATADTFLELGSGVGAITIVADLLGFDAYGIELEPALIEASWDLAERFGSKATFAEGSFVPPSYRDELALQSVDFLTITEGADAYAELGLALDDFDVVYGYPWPGEEEWMQELVRSHTGPSTSFLTYSDGGGYELVAL